MWTDKKGELEEVCWLAPTCDSADIICEDYKYPLPLNLSIGDRLYWFSTGTCTTSYSSVEIQQLPAAAGLIHLRRRCRYCEEGLRPFCIPAGLQATQTARCRPRPIRPFPGKRRGTSEVPERRRRRIDQPTQAEIAG